MRRSDRQRPGVGLPSEPLPPVVTVSGGPVGVPPAPEQERPRRRTGAAPAALVVGAVAVLGAAVLAGPAEPPALAVVVRVIDDQVLNSQSGVLVVPVEVVNRGPDVSVASSVARAEPVRSQPATTGTRLVAQGASGRLVVLLKPDCARVSSPRGTPFAAVLVVTVEGGERQSLQLEVDLGAEPAVATRVAAYCDVG